MGTPVWFPFCWMGAAAIMFASFIKKNSWLDFERFKYQNNNVGAALNPICRWMVLGKAECVRDGEGIENKKRRGRQRSGEM